MNKESSIALGKVRVFGVYAHIDAGKTTTSEAILYFTGRIHRAGSVDTGDTQLDWMEQERRRGITITAAATTCTWRGCSLRLIDTPGHIDFSAEVMRSIRVIDGAVIVLCGVGGVETQTETVWRHAEGKRLPRLIFVNKLDREFADFEMVLAEVKERLTPGAVALQLPIYSQDAEIEDAASTEEGALRSMNLADPEAILGRPRVKGQSRPRLIGVIDLFEERAFVWDEKGEEALIMPIPEEMAGQAEKARQTLLEAICETEDALLAQWVEGLQPETHVLRAALRRATIAGKLVPVLCGSAKNRIGVQPLLDAIVSYLPSPADMPPEAGILPGSGETVLRSTDSDQPFCASAFKIVADPHVGRMAWVRVFSGIRQVGDIVFNPRTGETERVGRIYTIHANRREHIGRMQAGDVVALVGVKSAITGDTLCDPNQPILLEAFKFPEPVISVAISPASDEERDRLQTAAARLCEEDPTLRLSFEVETGEQLLSGMGELHLEIAIDRLRSEYGLIAQASPFRIAYRETVQRRGESTGVYRKQSGGHGHFAIVRLRVEPLARGEGIVFHNTASPVDLPVGFVRAIEAGVREALEKGVLAGYPITDLRVTLVSGRYHEVDSNSLDFRIAGSMALRQAARSARPVLLEPVMRAEIRVDEQFLGPILADFGRRRGEVNNLALRNKERQIMGEVPLAEARGYATDLRSLTHGRGSFGLEFYSYERVPERLEEEIIAQCQVERRMAVR